MFPFLYRNYGPDQRAGNSKRVRKSSLSNPAIRVGHSDEPYLFFVKFCPAMIFTSANSIGMKPRSVIITPGKTFRMKPRSAPVACGLPSFGIPICDVIFIRPKPQMVRTNTRGIVAMMQNMKPFRDRPSVNNPRSPVCAYLRRNIKQSISPIFAGCPNPARAKLGTMLWYWSVFIDLLKKLFLGGFESLEVFVDRLLLRGKTLGRFAHNVLSVMTGFSGAGSAATGPRCDFAPNV